MNLRKGGVTSKPLDTQNNSASLPVITEALRLLKWRIYAVSEVLLIIPTQSSHKASESGHRVHG